VVHQECQVSQKLSFLVYVVTTFLASAFCSAYVGSTNSFVLFRSDAERLQVVQSNKVFMFGTLVLLSPYLATHVIPLSLAYIWCIAPAFLLLIPGIALRIKANKLAQDAAVYYRTISSKRIDSTTYGELERLLGEEKARNVGKDLSPDAIARLVEIADSQVSPLLWELSCQVVLRFTFFPSGISLLLYFGKLWSPIICGT